MVTISGRGFYDEDLRNWRKRTRQDDYAKRWQEIVVQLHPAAKLINLSTSDPEDLTMPFNVSFRYEVPGYAASAGDGIALKSPLATDCFERVVVDVIAKANRPERKYPFIVTSAAGVQAQETITLPRGYTVQSMPETVSLKTKDLSLAVRYTAPADASDPRVEFSKSLLVDSRQFDPESYLELRKVLQANSSSRKGQVILALPQ
jgi:hypothetical protein